MQQLLNKKLSQQIRLDESSNSFEKGLDKNNNQIILTHNNKKTYVYKLQNVYKMYK